MQTGFTKEQLERLDKDLLIQLLLSNSNSSRRWMKNSRRSLSSWRTVTAGGLDVPLNEWISRDR